MSNEKKKRKRDRTPTGRTAAMAWAALDAMPSMEMRVEQLTTGLKTAYAIRQKLEQEKLKIEAELIATKCELARRDKLERERQQLPFYKKAFV